jgi:peptidoglycan hydrolase CwlO-like protein
MAKKGSRKRRAGGAQDVVKSVQARMRQMDSLVKRVEREYRDLEKRIQKQLGQLGETAGKAAARAKSVAAGKKRSTRKRATAKKSAAKKSAAKKSAAKKPAARRPRRRTAAKRKPASPSAG